MTTLSRTQIYTRLLTLVFGIALILQAHTARASTIFAVTGDVHAQDVFAVRVMLDTEGKFLNTVDGTVVLGSKNSDFEISDISVAGSALGVWPRKPSLGTDLKTISFTGGAPDGFNDTHALLFTLFVQAKKPGTVHFTTSHMTGFLDTGSGASVVYKDVVEDIQVLKASEHPTDARAAVVNNDKEAPLPFTIEVLQDPSLFNGMKFISFETTDAGSGIAGYQVKEGDFAPVASGSTYVLQDQAHMQTIVVRAYDKAGNIQTETLVVRHTIRTILMVLGGLLVICVLFFKKGIRFFTKHASTKN